MKQTAQDRYSYDDLFYGYQMPGSSRSARHLLPAVLGALPVKSVLDIGCGAGTWLAEYRQLGVSDVCGVDGEYVNRARLLIEQEQFVPTDISKPFALGRQFDMVQCVEVAEHVPSESSSTLIDNIVRHSKRVLFSAAVPGQGGENHVNEQPCEFWRDLFGQRGYRLFDFVRPQVQRILEIEYWYRYNVLLFIHDDLVAELPPEVARTRVAGGARIQDVSPIVYRFRKAVLRSLPPEVISRLAVLKHKLIARGAPAGGR